jgi:Domain of unknown function (DUF4190)
LNLRLKALLMKRCPTCNQSFDEEWLSFCTQDGTALVDAEALLPEPPPTIMTPPIVPSATPAEQRTLNLPGGYSAGPGQSGWSKPGTPAWQPPPPPTYVQPTNKNLAIASMVVGLIGITVGWLCFGFVPAILAIILGAVALSQMKKWPERIGGKQFAWVGIVTGGLTFVIYLGFFVLYIIAAILSTNR